MMAREAIIMEARRWTGTPFQHQGRLRGIGVDCAGLVIGVARALGLSDYDVTGYAPSPARDEIVTHLDRAAVRVSLNMARPGDIVMFRILHDPQHLAILTDAGIIHAYSAVGRVVEHALDERWQRRRYGAWAFPGVDD